MQKSPQHVFLSLLTLGVSVKAPCWKTLSSMFNGIQEGCFSKRTLDFCFVWHSDFHASTFNRQQPLRQHLFLSAVSFLFLLFSDKHPLAPVCLAVFEVLCRSSICTLQLGHAAWRRLSSYSDYPVPLEYAEPHNSPWIQMCCCRGPIIKLFQWYQHCVSAPANPHCLCIYGCHEALLNSHQRWAHCPTQSGLRG